MASAPDRRRRPLACGCRTRGTGPPTTGPPRRLATLVGHTGAPRGPAVAPVGLRPPTPARGQDRGGVDDVALDPFGLQHPVDPEAVQTGLLNDDNREVPAGPCRC